MFFLRLKQNKKENKFRLIYDRKSEKNGRIISKSDAPFVLANERKQSGNTANFRFGMRPDWRGGKPIDYIQFLMTKKRETDQLQSGSPLLYWHPEQKKEEANYSQFLMPDSSFLIQSMV